MLNGLSSLFKKYPTRPRQLRRLISAKISCGYWLLPRFYYIEPSLPINGFWLFLPYSVSRPEGQGEFKYDFSTLPLAGTAHLEGSYEQPVAERVVQMVETTDRVLEIGSQFGYFTMIFSQLSRSVTAIDAIKENINYVRKSAERNNFENIYTSHRSVGSPEQLLVVSDRRFFDILFFDIEGYEFEILNESVIKEIDPHTAIIEIHHQDGLSDASIPDDPLEKMTQLWERCGYNTELIDHRQEHMIATMK